MSGCVVGVTDGEDDVDVVAVVESGECQGFFGWGERGESRFVDDEGIGDCVVIASVLIDLSKVVSRTGGR
jgi:hypothetical protein